MTQIQPESPPVQDRIAPTRPTARPPAQRKTRYSDPDDTKQDFSALSRRQRDLLPILANARTITEAAARARVSRSTIHRWLRDETFREALAYARANNDFIARLRLRQMVQGSLDQLMDTVYDLDPEVRIRAARSVLHFVAQMGPWLCENDTRRPQDDELLSWSVPPAEADSPLPPEAIA